MRRCPARRRTAPSPSARPWPASRPGASSRVERPGHHPRCWEDLAALPDEVAEHVLAVFVARRGADPESGETMRGVGGPLRTLHADLSGGRSIRAVTWYDRVEALARTDGHLPTAADIANFESDAAVRLM